MTCGRATTVIGHVPYCKCGVRGVRDETFDAYYCPWSGTWLERKCPVVDCPTCSGRPRKKQI